MLPLKYKKKPSDEINDLFAELDREYDGQIQNTDVDLLKEKGHIEQSINDYEQFTAGERMKSNESIHNFWEKNKSRFGQELYDIAVTIFSIPPTQASVERYFSALKYFFNDHRYNLSEDLLEYCMLIHLNPEFFEIVKTERINCLINDIRSN